MFVSSSQASSSQEAGNYLAQLDSAPIESGKSDNKLRNRILLGSVPGVRHAAVHQQSRVHLKAPQLHFDTSSDVTGFASHPVEEPNLGSAVMAKSGSGVTGFASHPGQKRNFGSAFTADYGAVRPHQVLRKKPRPQPVVPLMSQQPVQKERPLQKGLVATTTAGLSTVPDHVWHQRNLQVEMDVIEDVYNHTPHFGTPDPRVLCASGETHVWTWHCAWGILFRRARFHVIFATTSPFVGHISDHHR
jgi:hypothetical protein